MNEDQIRKVYHSLLESWNRNDPAAFAKFFTEEGSVVGFDGSQMNGRIQIEKELHQIFSNHKVASYVTIVREVRKLSDSVYLLRATAGMVAQGQNQVNPKVNAVQTLVAQIKDGQILISLFQNTPAAFHGRPELSLQLTQELQSVVDSK